MYKSVALFMLPNRLFSSYQYQGARIGFLQVPSSCRGLLNCGLDENIYIYLRTAVLFSFSEYRHFSYIFFFYTYRCKPLSKRVDQWRRFRMFFVYLVRSRRGTYKYRVELVKLNFFFFYAPVCIHSLRMHFYVDFRHIGFQHISICVDS